MNRSRGRPLLIDAIVALVESTKQADRRDEARRGLLEAWRSLVVFVQKSEDRALVEAAEAVLELHRLSEVGPVAPAEPKAVGGRRFSVRTPINRMVLHHLLGVIRCRQIGICAPERMPCFNRTEMDCVVFLEPLSLNSVGAWFPLVWARIATDFEGSDRQGLGDVLRDTLVEDVRKREERAVRMPPDERDCPESRAKNQLRVERRVRRNQRWFLVEGAGFAAIHPQASFQFLCPVGRGHKWHLIFTAQV